MDSLQNAKILVTGIQGDAGKWIVMAGKDKYSFFETKQDGTATVAFESFKKLGVSIGNEYGITFKANTKPNQYGVNVTYKNIMSFSDPASIEYKAAPTQTRTTTAPMPTYPVQPTTTKVTPYVWEKKERLSAAQTSLNCAATVWQGREVDPEKVVTYAQAFYNYLWGKRNSSEISIEDFVPTDDEEVNMEDIPL